MKKFILKTLPPVVYESYLLISKKKILFQGEYGSWVEAFDNCTGYDSEEILADVLESSIRVKNGDAAFCRDGVFFNKIQYSWPVTTSLLWVALRTNSELNVLDFGGSLGDCYFQNRNFLTNISRVSWHIVEQPHFVEAGKKNIEDNCLKFFSSIQKSVNVQTPDIILLSSVLQYLPNPHGILSELLETAPKAIIIDRTPFLIDGENSVIKIQKNPKSLGSSSYPCHFFNFDELIGPIKRKGYRIIEDFDSLDDLSKEAKWKGVLLSKSE